MPMQVNTLRQHLQRQRSSSQMLLSSSRRWRVMLHAPSLTGSTEILFRVCNTHPNPICILQSLFTNHRLRFKLGIRAFGADWRYRAHGNMLLNDPHGFPFTLEETAEKSKPQYDYIDRDDGPPCHQPIPQGHYGHIGGDDKHKGRDQHDHVHHEARVARALDG